MARRQKGIHRLSPRDIETLGEGLHADGKGLYLQVKGNSRSWLFRIAGRGMRPNWMGLGPTHTINADEAREKARICRQQTRDGINPLDARKSAERERLLAAAKDVTFRQCAEGWMQRNAPTWKLPTAMGIKRQLEKYVYPKLEAGNLPIQMLDVRTKDSAAAKLIVNILKPLWRPREEGGYPARAQHIRQHIEGILNWAWAADYIQGDAAAMKAKLDLLLPDPSFHVTKHHPAIDYKEVGAFMAKLRMHIDPRDPRIANRGGLRPLTTYAMELVILTATRKGEILKSEWKEIDWDDRLLIIPWQKHKVGKKTKEDHVVPLSDAAMAVLCTIKEWQEANGIKSDFIFPGLGRAPHLAASSLNVFMRRALGRADLTIHGFRTTFGRWSVEQGYEERDSEMALGHVVGNDVRNVYKRNAHRIEPRRLMMQAWADYCGQPLPPAATSDVINFQQAKRGAQ